MQVFIWFKGSNSWFYQHRLVKGVLLARLADIVWACNEILQTLWLFQPWLPNNHRLPLLLKLSSYSTDLILRTLNNTSDLTGICAWTQSLLQYVCNLDDLLMLHSILQNVLPGSHVHKIHRKLSCATLCCKEWILICTYEWHMWQMRLPYKIRSYFKGRTSSYFFHISWHELCLLSAYTSRWKVFSILVKSQGSEPVYHVTSPVYEQHSL